MWRVAASSRAYALPVVFFAGRLVSYTIYITGASAIKDTVGDVLVGSLTSPIGIAAQVIALAALVVFFRLDWGHILGRHSNGRAHDERRDGAESPRDRTR